MVRRVQLLESTAAALGESLPAWVREVKSDAELPGHHDQLLDLHGRLLQDLSIRAQSQAERNAVHDLARAACELDADVAHAYEQALLAIEAHERAAPAEDAAPTPDQLTHYLRTLAPDASALKVTSVRQLKAHNSAICAGDTPPQSMQPDLIADPASRTFRLTMETESGAESVDVELIHSTCATSAPPSHEFHGADRTPRTKARQYASYVAGYRWREQIGYGVFERSAQISALRWPTDRVMPRR